MIDRNYFTQQAQTLLRMARATQDRKLKALLATKAIELQRAEERNAPQPAAASPEGIRR